MKVRALLSVVLVLPAAGCQPDSPTPPQGLCRPADLDPRPYYAYGGASGTAHQSVIVQNSGRVACHLTGFPTLEGLDEKTGKTVTLPLEPRTTNTPVVVVQPGQYARFGTSHVNGNPYSPDAPECASPKSYKQIAVVFEGGSRYPLPGFALSWECAEGGVYPWSALDGPLDQVDAQVTRAP